MGAEEMERDMTRSKIVGLTASIVTVGAMALAASPAAAVTGISSSGQGLVVNLDVLTILPVSLDLGDSGVGTAPGPYSLSNSFLSATASANIEIGSVILPIKIGAVNVTTAGTNDISGSASSGFMPVLTGTGTGTISDLSSLDVSSLLDGTQLGISATTLSSTSTVTGFGSLDAFGASTIENLNIIVNGTALSFTVTGAPDQVIFDTGGLLIELNRQVLTGANGPASTADGITTDALYIQFSNFLLGTNLLNGNIDLGQSFASITGPAGPAPEPGAWALMLTGFAGMGAALRMRRRRQAATA